MKNILRHTVCWFTVLVFLLATNGMSIVIHHCASHQENFVGIFQTTPDCHENATIHNNCCASSDCCHNSDNECSSDNIFVKLLADMMLLDNISNLTSAINVFIVSNPIEIIMQAIPKIQLHNHLESNFVNTSGKVILSKISQFIL